MIPKPFYLQRPKLSFLFLFFLLTYFFIIIIIIIIIIFKVYVQQDGGLR